MKNTRSINLILAVITALWTPVWCCCASHESTEKVAAEFAASSSTSCAACPVKPKLPCEDPSHDGSNSSQHSTCPHSLLRSFAQLDKSPESKATFSAAFFLFLVDVTAIEQPTLVPSLTVTACDSAPHLASSTLLAMHCMLTI